MSDAPLQVLERVPMPNHLREFIAFGIKEAQSCVFAGSFFALLFISTQVRTDAIARYDLILIGALLIQIVLVATGIESRDEIKMIAAFHLIGLALELYKTHPSIGSWSYPEEALTKIGGVPLYSGFMYSAVGSYIAQAWRRFDLQIINYPNRAVTISLCVAIYVNFFTNHFFWDARYVLVALVVGVFFRSRVYFTPRNHTYWMPVWFSFALIGFFVWVAENISTFFGAWQYPNQALGWDVVEPSKLVSWSLLVILSFVLIAELRHVKDQRSP